jgi:hypothetical protein
MTACGETALTMCETRLLLPCWPSSDAERVRMVAAAKEFRARHPDGRIVSLVPEVAALRQAGFEAMSMDEVLPYGGYLDVWRRAYRLLDQFAAKAGPELMAIVYPFWHAGADLAMRTLMTRSALETVSGPLLLFAPTGAAEVWRELPVRLINRGLALGRISFAGLRLEAGMRALCFVLRPERLASLSSSVVVATPPKASGGKRRPAVLVVIEDGISGVNMPSARAIVRELAARDRAVVVLTGHPAIAREFAAIGTDVLSWRVPSPKAFSPARFWRWRRAYTELRRSRQDRSRLWEERAVAALLEERLLPFAVVGATIGRLLDGYRRDVGPIGAGLAVNEGTPTSIAALTWLRAQGVPDFGYWPALLGDRPDCEFFPASRHFVYGTQLLDKMVGLGIGPEKIEAVGSVNFDSSLLRYRVRDRAKVQIELLPGRAPRAKLVVVATEALPNPLEEIGPVIDALAPMADVEIVLKLHPADNADFYRAWLTRRGLSERVVLVERCDLDALLNAADLLVCVLSNIIVGAALLGTPTLVCDFGGKRRPLDFVAEGLATGCFKPEEVAGMLSAILRDGPVRDSAMSKLKHAPQRFNYGNDGQSAARVAERLEAAVLN